MTSSSEKSTSSDTRADMMAELQEMSTEQILALLEARRNKQSAPDDTTAINETEASTTTTDSPTRQNTPQAGDFAKAYSEHGLATEHSKMFESFKEVIDESSAEQFLTELCLLPVEDRPALIICSGGASPTLHTLHGLAMHPTSLRHPSKYDRKIFAFLGDSYAWSSGQKPASLQIQYSWFEAKEQSTPNITEFNAQLTSGTTRGYVNTTTSHKAIITQACLLPAEFAPCLLDREVTPAQAWPLLRAAARKTATTGKLNILWNWLRAVSDVTNHDSRVDIILPTAESEHFAETRRAAGAAIIKEEDTPQDTQRLPAASEASDAIKLLVKTLGTSFPRTSTSKKSVEARWPYHQNTLLRLCGVQCIADLPPVWDVLAAEKRGPGARAVLTVACCNVAANLGVEPPIITHDIANRVHDLAFVPDDRLDLLGGLSIWLFPVLTPAETATLLNKVRLWDDHLEGSNNPTLAETKQALSTAKLSPAVSFVPMYAMICKYEVVIVVLLGEAHLATIELRKLRECLFKLYVDLERMFMADKELASQIITEIRTQFIGFFRSAVVPRGRIMLPCLQQMADDIIFDCWRPPSLPPSINALLRPTQPPRQQLPAPHTAQQSQYTPQQGSTTARTQVQVLHPNPVQAFQVGQVTIKQFIERGRGEQGGEIPKADNGANLCLTFHLKGRCYSLCRGHTTHRTLSTPEHERLAAWHRRYCTTTTATAPQPSTTSYGQYTQPALPRDAYSNRGRGRGRNTGRQPSVTSLDHTPPVTEITASRQLDEAASTLGPDTARG